MIKILCGFIISFSSLAMLLGCQTASYKVHKSASNILVSRYNKKIINNIPLEYKVSIVGFDSRYHNDFLEIQINLQNNDQKLYDLEYKVIWFDDAGFVVDKTPWLPLTISAMDFKTIRLISHFQAVKDFKFYIRPKQ